MDTLRRSCSVPLPDGGREQYAFDGEQPFSRVTVSVVLGTNRQRKRWEYTVAQLGLRATPCDSQGDLQSFSVFGHLASLRALVGLKSIVRVEYTDAKPYHGSAHVHGEQGPRKRHPDEVAHRLKHFGA
jgi:hypothetical protein